ncbi:MAG: prohibitin family protein [Erysipelotrichaceae bacterium]|nr:prohibitin family protein [Erysipelotrichaceae bacterium]
MNRVTFTRRLLTGVFAGVLLLIILLSSVTVVKPGHTGVVVTMGKVEDNVLQEGFHLKIPFAQKVIEIDNRIVKLEVETEAFSKDLQTVETILAINYRIDKNQSYYIYKNIGSDYENILIIPSVNEVLKAITSRYTAEESVVNRVLISEGLVDGLNSKLNDFGLYVTDVNIINYEFSDAYINAIEEKQVAQQKLLTAETEKQTAITKAEAEAETIKIRAEAEAEANRILSASLNGNVIDYKKIEKWDGKLPTVSGSGGTIIDLGQ